MVRRAARKPYTSLSTSPMTYDSGNRKKAPSVVIGRTLIGPSASWLWVKNCTPLVAQILEIIRVVTNRATTMVKCCPPADRANDACSATGRPDSSNFTVSLVSLTRYGRYRHPRPAASCPDPAAVHGPYHGPGDRGCNE